jgi:Xaa-Pro dipeptidase
MSSSVNVSDRIRQLVDVMRTEDWDCVIASLPESILYLSGALIQTQTMMRRRQCAVLVTRDGAATLIVAEIEKALATRLSGLPRLVTYKELSESACSASASFLLNLERTPTVIGIEKTFLPVVDFEELTRQLPAARFVSADDQLMKLRMIKSDSERELMCFAAATLDEATLAAVREIHVGDSEEKVAIRICEQIQRRGGRAVRSAIGFVASGENLLVAHHHANSRRLWPGDSVKVGGRAIFDGYYGQVARMAVVGEAKPDFLDRYARAHQAHLKLVHSLRPGTVAGQVYSQAAATFRSLGLIQKLSHVGHGMGIEYMEHPKLAPNVQDRLQAGMTMQATTVCDDPQTGLIQIVDMVTLEPDGARIISNAIDTAEPLQIASAAAPVS